MIVRSAGLPNGTWQLCDQHGWPDNQSCHNLISWQVQAAGQRYVVVVNFSDYCSQARIILQGTDFSGRDWQVTNLLPRLDFGRRSGEEISSLGLYVDLEGQSYQFLELVPSPAH